MENTIIIDGFKIGLDNTFEYDDTYLHKRYLEFNERYFNNELPRIQVYKVTRKTNYLGVTHSKGLFNTRLGIVKMLSSISIEMNAFYQRSEKVVCSTLLHEMIHVYEASVLLLIPKHESAFKRKMNEINSYGDWDVSLTETVEEANNRGSAPQRVLDKLKNDVLLGALNLGDYEYFTFLFNKKDLSKYKSWFDRYQGSRVFKILDPTPYVEDTVCRSTPKGHKIVAGIIDGLVKKGTLEETVLESDEIKKASADGEEAKIKKIEKNCYFLCKREINPYYNKVVGYLVSKRGLSLYSEIWEYAIENGYDVYDIKDGSKFINEKVCSSIRTIRYTYGVMIKIEKEEFDNMKKEGIIKFNRDVLEEKRKRRGNKLIESISLADYIEQDPYTEVNSIKRIDDDTVEIDMTIS